MKRTAMSLAMLLAIAVAGCQGVNDTGSEEETFSGGMEAPASPASQEVKLFDGSSLEGWRVLGDANWHIVDDYVEANSGDGFLVTPDNYGDFHLTLEFWTDPDANSGIFIRCSDPNEVGAANAYEVNIYDKRPDPAYRTGGIVNVASPMEQIDAADQWNTYEISAEGSRLVVRLNGILTVDIEDEKFASGPIALQYGAGIVRFRNVHIRPL